MKRKKFADITEKDVGKILIAYCTGPFLVGNISNCGHIVDIDYNTHFGTKQIFCKNDTISALDVVNREFYLVKIYES